MSVVDASFGQPLKPEEKASMPFAGGIMQHGFQCGMLWGAALAAGAEAHRRFGSGAKAEAAALTASQAVVAAFRERTEQINCMDITELDMQDGRGILRFLVKGGPIGCFRLAASYAPEACEAIDAALDLERGEELTLPVSCSSLLARKMGVSSQHATMAAGLAGGIGLCGGACGALGTAIWITAMNKAGDAEAAMAFMSPEGAAVIDRFVESSDYEFECAAIVGRHFESVADHAAHVQAGGCAGIMEALAD